MIICTIFPSFPTFFRSLFPSVCAMMNIVSISGGFFYYEYCFPLQYLMGHSDISVTMNVYTHIGFDDAEEELKRMEEFRKAQAEVEQKKEKPMSQKMFKVV